ncbi:hypothetical protein [Oceanobacillus neutriphilus]|uniref:Uncharacterized protein n=1 Tax=Oceanobacillus neutriphilus TaxID=531815 RepID=A0ABQ2NZM1_9BACI|nr:hypothetical protein [Oceanobacillus neutriphilus]GGP14226.1 hypothetical protein GCM10011346_37520 [Oceanobacillus neutriphilus]
MSAEFIREVIVPIVSILTFIFSVSVLFVQSYTQRRRLLISNVLRLAKFSELKFAHDGPTVNQKGIIVSFNIINPSPHDIGVNNFKYINGGRQVFIEVNQSFNTVYLDNIVETFPTLNDDIILKANSQERVNFLILESEYQNITTDWLEVQFDAIFSDFSFVFKRPVKLIKSRRIPLKRYRFKDYIDEDLKKQVLKLNR